MKYLREKVSYLKGLADGLPLDENTNEGKVLRAIIEVLDDMFFCNPYIHTGYFFYIHDTVPFKNNFTGKTYSMPPL